MTNLVRVRWAVRAVLALGVAASVTANILHANPNPISQTIAAWPPVALLLTVELISRVPVHRPSLAFARFVATAVIAGIAAWVSYWHMVGVAARYGESGASPYLLPVSVDGLILVASVCLVELAGRIAETQPATEPVATPAPERATVDAPAPRQPRRRVAPVRHDTDARQTARDMYRDGTPPRDIAEALRASRRTVERWTQDLRQPVPA